MENTNVITISIEEYKDLIRVAVEKEFHEQIIGLQEQIKKMEETHLEDCNSLREDKLYWYNRYIEADKKVGELEKELYVVKEELDFYKPAKQEEAS